MNPHRNGWENALVIVLHTSKFSTQFTVISIRIHSPVNIIRGCVMRGLIFIIIIMIEKEVIIWRMKASIHHSTACNNIFVMCLKGENENERHSSACTGRLTDNV